MAWFDYVNSVGIVGALAVAAYQTRQLVSDARARDRDRRTERALELYRDLVVDGDTANAFHRLSVLLRHEGSRRFGITTWYVMTDGEFEAGGLLDPSSTGMNTPFEDFYRVIWYFERVENSLRFKLVEPDVLFHAVGFHCWWWNQLLGEIKAPKASRGLRSVAEDATSWAKVQGIHDDWLTHCSTDFNGSCQPALPSADRGPVITPAPTDRPARTRTGGSHSAP